MQANPGWPWADQLVAAFTRLAGIDNPCWPNQPARHRPPTTKDPGKPDTKPADPHALEPKINNPRPSSPRR